MIRITGVIIDSGNIIFNAINEEKDRILYKYIDETLTEKDVIEEIELENIYFKCKQDETYEDSISGEIYTVNKKEFKRMIKCNKVVQALKNSKANKEFIYKIKFGKYLKSLKANSSEFNKRTKEEINDLIVIGLFLYRNSIVEKSKAIKIPDFVTELDSRIIYGHHRDYKIVAKNIEGDLSNVFSGYHGKHIDLTEFNLSKVNSISGIFRNCINLKTIDFGEQKISENCNIDGMINGCFGLEELKVKGFNLKTVTGSMISETSTDKLIIDIGKENKKDSLYNINLLKAVGYIVMEDDSDLEIKLNRVRALKGSNDVIIIKTE